MYVQVSTVRFTVQYSHLSVPDLQAVVLAATIERMVFLKYKLHYYDRFEAFPPANCFNILLLTLAYNASTRNNTYCSTKQRIIEFIWHSGILRSGRNRGEERMWEDVGQGLNEGTSWAVAWCD